MITMLSRKPVTDAEMKRLKKLEAMRRWRARLKAGIPFHRISLDERFEKFTLYAGDCIVWVGTSPDGRYGQFRHNGRQVYAHRFAYERMHGPIPRGLVMDHLCRNTLCVNPAHLEPVTQAVNWHRGLGPLTSGTFNNNKTHCPEGHPYAGENLYIDKRRNHRRCRICMAASSKSR